MAQNHDFTKPADDGLLTTSPQFQRNNFEALASSFSGAVFPSNPVAGQVCWRTDELKEYTHNGIGWIESGSSSTSSQEVVLARGTKPSLDQRLDVAFNEDGTLKIGVNQNISEWVAPVFTFTYVDSTTFTVDTDQTDIYLPFRRIKINLGSSVVYSEVVSSSFGTVTTITILDAVLDDTVISVEHSLVRPIDNNGSVSSKMVGLSGSESISSTFEKTNNNEVLFIKADTNSFTIPSGLQIKIDDTIVKTVSDITVTVSSPIAGTDYKVFAKADGSFYADTANAGTDKLIGGFHYGLVGATEAATGNKTETDMVAIRGINAYSFWDLKFRPVCDTEGMTYVNGRWYDIYLLNSEHIANGTSKAGATIAGGATDYGRAIPKIPLMYGGDGTISYGKLTWFQLCEIAKSHGKSLISHEEFSTIAYGVLEGADCSSLEVTQGSVEHYDTLTSKFGIEQASGVQYVWGKDLMNGYGTTSFSWMDETDSRGQIYATSTSPIAITLGGGRTGGVYAGSRASTYVNYIWNSRWDFGCRFSCNHLKTI